MPAIRQEVSEGGKYVGGLVGINYGSGAMISACYSTGSVEGTGSNARVGGLVGVNGGPISACYSTGSVEGTGDYASVGGLVGYNNGGQISGCYSTGSVEGTGSHANVGGLVGDNRGTISACYATGSVTGGTGDDAYVGGLVGINYESTISACYSTGSVEGGDDARVGGLVGDNYESTISACYSTGSVEGGDDARVGGLVGYNYEGSIAASYFDATTSGLTVGIGNMTDPYVMGKTTAQLQYPRAYAGVDAAPSGTAIYSAWNVDVDNADGDDDLTTMVDDPWDFGANNRYPKLKVDFDRDGMTPTAAEFGVQRFYFTDASDVEFFSFSVAEGTTSGTIGFAKALTGSPGFSLTDDNFLINSTTGEITVESTADLDFEDETKNSFELAIVATVGSFSANLRLNIEVTDVDEVAPVFDPTSYAFDVLPGSVANTVVGTVSATDDVSSTLTYSLTGTENEKFAIDEMGQMTVASDVTLPSEKGLVYTLRVTASDEAMNASTAATVSVTLNNPSLIDITTLEQLNAIRYDLDGDGVPTICGSTSCAYNTAFGHEYYCGRYR